MRAVVITKPGGTEALDEQERPIPEPGLGQIRVRVHASALNRADVMQRRGSYPAPAGVPPDIPGLEYAGEVDALGPSAGLWEIGNRVMGLVGGGGHAEYVCASEREAMPAPAQLSWEECAAIPEAFLTAYDALFRQLRVTAGERLLIHAVGSGVGTAALQLARVAGISTIGTSRSEAKLEKARELGLEEAIDTSAGDWVDRVEAITGGKGVSAILDLVGGSFFEKNIQVMALKGRLIVVGLTAGRKSEIDLGAVLNKRLRIFGTMLRSRPPEEKIVLAQQFSDRVVPMFESGKLRPIIHWVYSFSEVRAAHTLMESDSNFGKIVLRWD